MQTMKNRPKGSTLNRIVFVASLRLETAEIQATSMRSSEGKSQTDGERGYRQRGQRVGNLN